MTVYLTDDCKRAAEKAANAVIENERRNTLVDELASANTRDMESVELSVQELSIQPPETADTDAADTYIDQLTPAPKNTRKRLDQYYTPQPVADALVAHYLTRFPKPRIVVEPSVGKGAWAQALNEQAQPERIVGVDLEPKSDCFCDKVIAGDFVQYDPCPENPDLIIGNPPFSHALAHVKHALSIVKRGGRVAFLLRLAFMETKDRAPFWAENKPRLVTVLAQRPSFTGGGTDSAAYGFFVWEDGYDGPSEIVPGFDWRNK